MEALRLIVPVLSPEHAVSTRAADGRFERLPPQQLQHGLVAKRARPAESPCSTAGMLAMRTLLMLLSCSGAAGLTAGPRMQASRMQAQALAGDALLERSLLAARACSLAFVPPSGMRFEPYATGLSCVAQIEDPDTFSGATVFRTDAGATIVACRGSASLKNFGTTTDIGPVPLIVADGAPTAARVHRGFQRACTGMWPLLKPHLPASGPLLLTGHSLGGGTATLLSLQCHAAGLEPELITVAGPRLGDAAFATYYRERCGEAVHLVHNADDVLKSNTKLWDDLGFEHVGKVVRAEPKPRCRDPTLTLTLTLTPTLSLTLALTLTLTTEQVRAEQKAACIYEDGSGEVRQHTNPPPAPPIPSPSRATPPTHQPPL